jgi:hypothetical protein
MRDGNSNQAEHVFNHMTRALLEDNETHRPVCPPKRRETQQHGVYVDTMMMTAVLDTV